VFDISWSRKSRSLKPRLISISSPSNQEILYSSLLRWEEHCVECAAPDCYSSCLLYKPRIDGACARFVDGINLCKSDYDSKRYLKDIILRRWAKIETRWTEFPRKYQLQKLELLEKLFYFFQENITKISYLLYPRLKIKLFNTLLSFLERKIFPYLAIDKKNTYFTFDGFLIEFYLHDEKNEEFQFEILDHNLKSRYRKGFCAQKGWNNIFIDSLELPKLSYKLGFARLWHCADYEVRISIAWMDLVKFKTKSSNKQMSNFYGFRTKTKLEGETFIKCVVFDLDNTLWQGILGDDDTNDLVLNKNIIRLIKELDSRGIICSIASKNEFQLAWKKLKELGLSDYFLFPKINWHPKSESISQIAKDLNISIDSIAFIDDNPFERQEVKTNLSGCRVYSNDEVLTLLSYPEFNPKISLESKKRRSLYLTEIKRNNFKRKINHNQDDFLRSCNMKLKIYDPRINFLRCHELIQRSNQFNISGVKYESSEFISLLDNGRSFCYRISDKFGDYGIVGFFRVIFDKNSFHLVDYVMSCRVAEKKVEETILYWLQEYYKNDGEFNINFINTKRNKPIKNKLKTIGFLESKLSSSNSIFTMKKGKTLENPEIMDVNLCF